MHVIRFACAPCAMTLCSDMIFSLDSMVNSAQTGFSFGAVLVPFWCRFGAVLVLFTWFRWFSLGIHQNKRPDWIDGGFIETALSIEHVSRKQSVDQLSWLRMLHVKANQTVNVGTLFVERIWKHSSTVHWVLGWMRCNISSLWYHVIQWSDESAIDLSVSLDNDHFF